MGIGSSLYSTIERTVEGLGYELVDVERLAGGLLRVTLDSAQGVGLDDCERVSRQLTHLAAVEGIEYERLEVSSPGLDRPLKRVRDFQRFAGSEIYVQLTAALPADAPGAGRKRLQGRLLEVAGAPGAERARLQLRSDDGGTGASQRGRRARVGTGRATKVGEQAAVVVEFALADVVKAKLIPEINFRGAAGADARSRNQ
jgi:ribosome maturation factor RimP